MDFSAPATFDFDIQLHGYSSIGKWTMMAEGRLSFETHLYVNISPINDLILELLAVRLTSSEARFTCFSRQSQAWDGWNSLLVKKDV